MNRGLTLLELLVALVILVMLGVLAIQPLAKFRTNEALDTATTQILSTINEARQNTLASKNDTVYGVHFAESQVVLFEGAVFSPSDPDNKEYNLDNSVHISDISISGGSNVVFERLTGETSNIGHVTLSGTSQDVGERTISINGTGLASEDYD